MRQAGVFAGLVLLAFAGALVLIISPTHWAFYFERASGGAPGSREDGGPRHGRLDDGGPRNGPPYPPGARSAPAKPWRSSILPQDLPRLGGAVAITKPSVFTPDADGRMPIPLADPVPVRLPADGVPASWKLKEFDGRANLELQPSDIGLALRLRSEGGSFVIYRDLVVDLGELPLLSWSWMVTRLPAGGDVRQAATDDQAVQVYVVFPRWPSPRTSSDVIGYVWDTTAPVDTRLPSRKAANVRIIVVESGAAGLATWRRHERNIVADYVALFGRQPPRVGSVAVMVDANDTGSTSEAWIAELAFSRLDRKTPTPMLR